MIYCTGKSNERKLDIGHYVFLCLLFSSIFKNNKHNTKIIIETLYWSSRIFPVLFECLYA